MQLSVIINTYERPEPLGRCLAALAGQRVAAAFEVIVVDDGGHIDLKPLATPWRDAFPIRILPIPHAGRAGARNRGVEVASGERLLFLGDDVMVEPGCLARHLGHAECLTAVVGPYPWRGLTGSPPFRRWAEPNPQRIDDPQNAGFWFFATGNLSMSRAAFLELGGFDPRFEVYGWEDIDLGLRLERAGGRIIFDPEARAVHDHPGMGRPQLWQREFEMGLTAWQFWDKWSAEAGEKIKKMKFWNDPATIHPGPAWRRRLGERLLGLLDTVAPDSRLTWRLYERMIFAHRLAGVAEGFRRARGRA